MTAAEYARALYESPGVDAARVVDALRRRRHQRLAPQIIAEYHKLELGNKRMEAHKKMTPQKERTRTLLELYRKLINV